MNFPKAFALVVSSIFIAVACSNGPSGPDRDPAPILGACNLEPNFISEVRLNRWQAFPLRYFVNEATFPETNRNAILAAIEAGIREWALSTSGRIGSLTRMYSPDGADFVIEARDFNGSAAAVTIHRGGSPFLHDGRMTFDRPTAVRLLELQRSDLLSALAAHEMGHLLGIIGHPVMGGTLMHAPLQSTTPTAADINTLSHAYCR